jgi:hypothetical protein
MGILIYKKEAVFAASFFIISKSPEGGIGLTP